MGQETWVLQTCIIFKPVTSGTIRGDLWLPHPPQPTGSWEHVLDHHCPYLHFLSQMRFVNRTSRRAQLLVFSLFSSKSDVSVQQCLKTCTLQTNKDPGQHHLQHNLPHPGLLPDLVQHHCQYFPNFADNQTFWELDGEYNTGRWRIVVQLSLLSTVPFVSEDQKFMLFLATSSLVVQTSMVVRLLMSDGCLAVPLLQTAIDAEIWVHPREVIWLWALAHHIPRGMYWGNTWFDSEEPVVVAVLPICWFWEDWSPNTMGVGKEGQAWSLLQSRGYPHPVPVRGWTPCSVSEECEASLIYHYLTSCSVFVLCGSTDLLNGYSVTTLTKLPGDFLNHPQQHQPYQITLSWHWGLTDLLFICVVFL